MHYVGIDIAKFEHVIGAIDEKGERTLNPITVGNTEDGFVKLLKCLKQADITADNCVIGMEATGHYWLSIFEFLTDHGFAVSVINPIQTDAFREVISIRKTKTDAIDCILIAELMRFGAFKPSTLPEETKGALKQLTRFRTSLVMELGALKNKATAVLDRVFPEYSSVFNDVFGAGSMALLAKYPTPEDIAAADIRTLTNVLTKASKGHFGREKAELIKKEAKASIGSSFATRALAFELRQIIERISFTQDQLAPLEEEISRLLKDTNGIWLTTIGGLGDTLAAVLTAELGDVELFDNEHSVMAFAGMDPSKMQSGQFDGDRGKMSKRGSPHLRRGLMLAADCVRKQEPYFGDYYDKLIARGKHHYVALSGVARKLIAVMLILMKEQRAYKPAPPKRS